MADVNVTFIKQLTAVPKAKTQIHTLAAPGATAKAALELAKSIGVDSARAVQAQDPVRFTYTAGQHVVTLFKASGAVRYHDATRWQMDDGKSNVKLTDAQAQKLATAVVSKYKLAGANEFKLLKVTRLMVGEANVKTKRTTERAIDVGVAFQRLVNGVPVEGPGGKLIVYLDQKGQLSGFDRIWRPIKAVQAPVTQLRAPSLAQEHLVKYWQPVGVGHIQVQEVRFGYFELGYQDTQRVLQPAYVMPILLIGPDERIRMQTMHVFPAAANAVGQIMPPPKPVVKQPVRRK